MTVLLWICPAHRMTLKRGILVDAGAIFGTCDIVTGFNREEGRNITCGELSSMFVVLHAE